MNEYVPTMRQAAYLDGGNPLIPTYGYLPPRVLNPRPERVMHIALDTPLEKQPSLCESLKKLGWGRYAHLDWIASETAGTLPEDAVRMAHEFCPTVIFMQLQRATPITRATVKAMKQASGHPELVVINWDGDFHYEPDSPQRQWFVDLGAECDTSLVVSTTHAFAYGRLGVRNAGYLQIGVDMRHFATGAAPRDEFVPELVLLANRYDHDRGYDRRTQLVRHLVQTLGPKRFAVFGEGWNREDTAACARPFLLQHQEGPIYHWANFALCMSRSNHAARYTSDRLFRAMAAGVCPLVERFPDNEGLGLQPGFNCFLWDDEADLRRYIDHDEITVRDAAKMGDEASKLAREHHTWDVRMQELGAILQVVRARRRETWRVD